MLTPPFKEIANLSLKKRIKEKLYKTNTNLPIDLIMPQTKKVLLAKKKIEIMM